ncbi:hypothetical protein B0H14DRAFT_2404518, partial [Mycena olivaceomarginata]
DGPLMRSDDPANADVLAVIHTGHAPPSVLNVYPGQRVDVQVTKPTEDDHVPPPAKPFSDPGNRLGAPVSAPRASSASAAPPALASNVNINPRLEVDTTRPTKSIQVRLANGTRCVLRFLFLVLWRNFDSSSLGTRPAGRPYAVGTTFPMRALDPAAADARTGKEAGLGGVVVVQSWA